jgi:GntR family transcriptional regulator
MELDKIIPYYYQIREDIVEQIESGVYSHGEQIPTETELAAKYGVSRPTIRQAILALVNEGILVRTRGKGTFVSTPRIMKDAQVFSTFAEDMTHRGITQESKTIIKHEISASVQVANALMIPPKAPTFEFVRLRIGNGENLVLRTSHIAKSICPELIEQDLDSMPLYDIIKDLTGLVPMGATQSFRAVVATSLDAKLLQISAGDPLMLWEGTIYANNQKPIEHVRALYRGDRHQFFIDQGMVPVKRDESTQIHSIGILNEL